MSSAAHDEGMVEVARLSDLEDGRMHVVEVGRRAIGLLRWGQCFYALRSVCPHQSAPLCAGSVSPKLVPGGKLGELAVDMSDPVVECPWHGWEFHVSSGRAVGDARMRVATYPVHVEDDRVFIELRHGRRKDGLG